MRYDFMKIYHNIYGWIFAMDDTQYVDLQYPISTSRASFHERVSKRVQGLESATGQVSVFLLSVNQWLSLVEPTLACDRYRVYYPFDAWISHLSTSSDFMELASSRRVTPNDDGTRDSEIGGASFRRLFWPRKTCKLGNKAMMKFLPSTIIPFIYLKTKNFIIFTKS